MSVLLTMSKMLGLGSSKKSETKAQEASADAQDGGKDEADDEDERVRFTISTGGRRMSKAEFIDQLRQLDPKSRVQVVEDSNAPENVKQAARADPRKAKKATLARPQTPKSQIQHKKGGSKGHI